MVTINNLKQLKSYLDSGKHLRIDDDVQITFRVPNGVMRDVFCKNLTLKKGNQLFDFTGNDFNGENLECGDFQGCDFNGRDLNAVAFLGCDFNGRDCNLLLTFDAGEFNGRNLRTSDFIGERCIARNIEYGHFFCCVGEIHCEKIESIWNDEHANPISLANVIEIKPQEGI